MLIKEIVRLKYQFNQSVRAIADSVGCSKSTVANVLESCKTHQFDYESIKQHNDEELHQIFYPSEKVESDMILPDWEKVDDEINARGSRKNIKFLYSKCFFNGETDASRSYFYQKYREWKETSNGYIYSPIDRKPGQNLYIDWVGPTVDCVRNPDTGNLRTAYFFITTLGLSSYPFCLACEHMSQSYWNEAHIKALKWYGGISECWVPDNTKTAVISRNCYDIKLNRLYREMGRFYDVAIIPAILGIITLALVNMGKIDSGIIMQGGARYTLPHLAMNTMPAVVIGILFAGIISATMSSADSDLLGAGSIFGNEVYKVYINKDADNKQVMKVTKLVMAIIGLLAYLFALFNTGSIIKVLMFAFSLRAAGAFFPYIIGLY
jgi:hypothetical protein